MSHKINKIWNKISYETIIFGVIMIRFLSTRALDLNTWATAWDAMDYSMGNGSRLLIGSIYRLFYGEYLDITVAYKLCRNWHHVDDSGFGGCVRTTDTKITRCRLRT